MKKELELRLAAIEGRNTDWISRLDFIDYLKGLSDYDENEWDEIHHDETITVLRNRETDEVVGVYADRRTHEELEKQGADLAYL